MASLRANLGCTPKLPDLGVLTGVDGPHLKEKEKNKTKLVCSAELNKGKAGGLH